MAFRLYRSSGGGINRHVVLLGASLFGLGMLPQALQRPDSTHLSWGSCVSFALLPCLFVELVPRAAPRFTRHAALVAGAAIAAILLVVNPFFTYRYYLLQARVSVGNKPGGYEVTRGDRSFYFGNQALQVSSQAAIDDLDRLSQPGDRLLVGPADLSRTIYSDAAFYYLFPELTPGHLLHRDGPGPCRPGRVQPGRRRRQCRLVAAHQLLDGLVRAQRVQQPWQRSAQPGGCRQVLPRR